MTNLSDNVQTKVYVSLTRNSAVANRSRPASYNSISGWEFLLCQITYVSYSRKTPQKQRSAANSAPSCVLLK